MSKNHMVSFIIYCAVSTKHSMIQYLCSTHDYVVEKYNVNCLHNKIGLIIECSWHCQQDIMSSLEGNLVLTFTVCYYCLLYTSRCV